MSSHIVYLVLGTNLGNRHKNLSKARSEIDELPQTRISKKSKIFNLLKPHQITGSKWMIRREKSKIYKGGILADDPGLGKTFQIIQLLKLK